MHLILSLVLSFVAKPTIISQSPGKYVIENRVNSAVEIILDCNSLEFERTNMRVPANISLEVFIFRPDGTPATGCSIWDWKRVK